MINKLRGLDWTFVIVPIVLTIISIATIYTVTYVTVGSKLAMSQGLYALIGFGLLFFFSFYDYRHLKSYAVAALVASFILLIPLMSPLSHHIPLVICEFDSCRWINLVFFRLQPSEIFKLVIIISFAALLADRVGRSPWWHLLGYLALAGLAAAMIMKQPDLGTAVVVAVISVVLLFSAKFPRWIWLVMLAIAIVAAPIVWDHMQPYQKNRIDVFLHPEKDPNNTGYNIRQAEIAVGNGGLMGQGFGQGSQSQLDFLPVVQTDFIFSGYAESTGYVGSVFLILVYGILIWRAIHVAEISKDNFGRFMALGIATLLIVQILVNIGMNIRLMPVTGVPLPLVSYGGTSLFITMAAIGILQSIYIRHKKISFT